MTQPSLLSDLPAPRPRKKGHVPATSVEAFRQTDAKGRATRVLRWLKMRPDTTSAELARFAFDALLIRQEMSWLELLLFSRRGLSDLQAIGAVEKAGTRRCAISGRQCATWRVSQR